MDTLEVNWEEVRARANHVAVQIKLGLYDKKPRPFSEPPIKIYPIPTGGIFAAQAIVAAGHIHGMRFEVVEDPTEAKFYVDDLVDSGDTRKRIKEKYGGKAFYALFYKRTEGIEKWIRFPWERMQNEKGPEDNIRRIIEYIGEDPKREGLIDTPARVVKSYDQLFSGYKQDPKDLFKVFEDGACDEMVILRGIEFWSTCEHHLLPFFGQAHIAYIPNGKVIGISKLARILECFSRRVQIQERLTEQITNTLDEYLEPKGSACVLEAKHLCMVMRGVQKQQADMITSSLTGVFRTDSLVRAEFFHMTRK